MPVNLKRDRSPRQAVLRTKLTLVAQRKEAEQLPCRPQCFQIVVERRVRDTGHSGVGGRPAEGLLSYLFLGHRLDHVRT